VAAHGPVSPSEPGTFEQRQPLDTSRHTQGSELLEEVALVVRLVVDAIPPEPPALELAVAELVVDVTELLVLLPLVLVLLADEEVALSLSELSPPPHATASMIALPTYLRSAPTA